MTHNNTPPLGTYRRQFFDGHEWHYSPPGSMDEYAAWRSQAQMVKWAERRFNGPTHLELQQRIDAAIAILKFIDIKYDGMVRGDLMTLVIEALNILQGNQSNTKADK